MSSSGDECGKGGNTLIWRIENFRHIIVTEGMCLYSVRFFVANLNTTWLLEFYPRGKDNDCIECCLKRTNYSEGYSIDCEMCICTTSGERISVIKKDNIKFVQHSSTSSVDAVFDRFIDDLLPHDTLVFHCHIWKNPSPRTDISIHYHHITRNAVLKHLFVWKVNKFSSMLLQEENTFVVNKTGDSGPTLTFKLSLCGSHVDEASVQIVIYFTGITKTTLISCNISLLDHTGTLIKFMDYEQRVTGAEKMKVFPHFLTRRELMADKASFLPDDTLSLKCEVTISDGQRDIECVEQVLYGQSTRDAMKLFQKRLPPLPKTVEETDLDDLHQDLGLFHDSGALSDFELSAGGRAFPVHRLILSVRSPVFRAMFENDMLEKAATSLDIPDLDSGTLDRMIRYVYTDAVPDMDWKDAARLYFAADKYQLEALKQRCSALLHERLEVSNAVEILGLADRHRDMNLTGAVQDFVFNRGRLALSADEWKLMEEVNPQLALETLRHILYEKVLVPPSVIP